MRDRTKKSNEFIGHRSKLGRRTVLRGATGIAAAGLTGGIPFIARARPERMTIPNSGGALEEAYRVAYFDTFTAKTGIAISGAPYAGLGKIKAMVESGAVDVDVMNIDATEAAVGGKQGLFEPIDYDIVDPNKLIPEANKEFYILADVAAYVMAWSTQAFNNETRPQNWGEFFDVNAKPGQRSLWKLAAQTLEVAAMGGGVPKDKLYPIDVDLALATLDKIKGNLTWWESGAQSAQLLIDGEVDVGTSWNGRVHKPKIEGAPVDFTFQGCLFVCDAMVVPKGAPNKKESMEFLAHMVEAQHQATFTKHIPYGPVNPEAFKLLDEDTLANLPNSPQNAPGGVFQDFDYWADAGDALFDRFNKWLLG